MAPSKIRVEDLTSLAKATSCKNLIFYFDAIEVDSAFKEMLQFHKLLKAEFLIEYRIIIISSIRENILEKFNYTRLTHNAFFTEINIDVPFKREEAAELVARWNKTGLLRLRDKQEADKKVNEIISQYKGDNLVSFFNLIEQSNHSEFIDRAYRELSDKTQKAFLLTSLLYRYKIKMPANVLRSALGMDWDTFTEEVIKKDGKNILIQVNTPYAKGFDPDLHFITRHDTISDYIIRRHLRDTKRRYSYYKSIINVLSDNFVERRLLVDLLKAIQRDDKFELSRVNIDSLFDIASKTFSEDAHFLIQYAINLSNRHKVEGKIINPEGLIKAEELLKYRLSEEQNVFRRNHKLVHRRAVVCFELAKYHFDNFNYKLSEDYEEMANDFFQVKKYLDPLSSYSFIDYIKFKLWQLEHNDNSLSSLQAEIEELFDESKYVYGDLSKIKEFELEYFEKYKAKENDAEFYEDLLLKIERESEERPYLLIMLYYWYQKKKDPIKMEGIVTDLNRYDDLLPVSKVLLKHYGRRLYDPNFRIKLFNLLNSQQELYEKDFLRCQYFSFVAETYSGRFRDGRRALQELRSKIHYTGLNPDFREIWKEIDGTVRIFKGNVVRNHKDDKQFIMVHGIPGNIRLNTHKSLSHQQYIEVEIFFTLFGLLARPVNTDF